MGYLLGMAMAFVPDRKIIEKVRAFDRGESFVQEVPKLPVSPLSLDDIDTQPGQGFRTGSLRTVFKLTTHMNILSFIGADCTRH